MMEFKFINPASPEYETECMLRWEALGKPLGLPPDPELIAQDEKSMHLIAVEKKKIIGCVCFLAHNAFDGEIFQMAVSEEYQGRGFGRKLMHTMEQALYEKGFRQLRVFAGQEAEGFYEKMGYHPENEYIKRNGAQCRLMKKNLLHMQDASGK
jgi:ribosomal protein S18 acetylase RimI-like enzyme